MKASTKTWRGMDKNISPVSITISSLVELTLKGEGKVDVGRGAICMYIHSVTLYHRVKNEQYFYYWRQVLYLKSSRLTSHDKVSYTQIT